MPDFDKLQEMLGDEWVLTDWQKEILTRWWESGGNPAKVVARRKSTVSTTPPTKRGTRLDSQWLPIQTVITDMRVEFPHITRDEWTLAHKMFIDYWTAVPGQKGCKLDWHATWRNWMRKEFSSPQYRRRAPSSAPSRVDAKAQSYLEG